ncbi:hypothetical protein MP638_002580 [Amoeboaphelidium occidentale]|nr:hypothetical protein MP638_002580 [Amoeboaphelidium occidentale]
MKLISKNIDKNANGVVKLCPEDSEDMWHIYNLLRHGDNIKATTVRRIQSESATGSVDSHRVKLTLTVAVEDVFFDTQAGALRINGRVTEENQHVKMGSYHTIDLEENRNVQIIKQEWDSLDLSRLRDACDVAKKAEVAAVVMEEGLSNVCLLTENMTIVRQRIEVNIPKKRKGSTNSTDKAMEKFYDQTYQALLKNVDFGVVKVMLIASPGFYKEKFLEFILREAQKNENKMILSNRDKFLLVNCSSGHKASLDEALKDERVQKRLSETKYAQEIRALEEFFSVLNDNPDKAFYGLKHVQKANELGAIKTLLLTDKLFKSIDVPTRKKYIEIVETVKQLGGNVFIFSSLHVSGEQLDQFTGCAAVLKFPCPQIEDEID